MWPVTKSSHSFRSVYDSGGEAITGWFGALRAGTGASPASWRVRTSCHSPSFCRRVRPSF